MADNENIYGGLGQIGNFLTSLADRGLGAASATGLYGLGGASDLAGIIMDNLGLDDLALERRADAKNIYDRALDQLTGGYFGGNTLRNPSKPVRMFGEDMTFADTFGERAEAKEQSVQEMLNELNQSVGLPDRGPVDTSKIKESNQSKAEAEASLQSEADQAQLFDNKLSADRASEKEAFRAEEEARIQGTVPTEENMQKAVNEGFGQAMEDYLQKAGKGKSVSGTGGARSLEDYKKEFAKATGIDIEGGPDKSNFLMALGLGLMQNKAGKGFDVSKILTSVGEATEKAMPKLEEAKKQYKAEQMVAGQYAIKARNKDRATAAAAAKKLKETKGYFIVPTGGETGLKPSEFVARAGDGKFVNLSNAQIDDLRNDADFNKNFTVLPGAMWGDLVKEAISTPEGKDLYLTKNPRDINLIGNDDEAGASIFEIRVYDPDVNKNPNGKPLMIGDGTSQYKALAMAAQDLKKAKSKFIEGFGIAEGTNVFKFSLDKVDSLAGAFGIKLSDKLNPTAKLDLFLTKLQAQNAKEILGEAGKTISDADRALVRSIVGNVNIFSDPRLLSEKMNQLYNDIIIKKERQIFAALDKLDGFTGRNVAQILYSQDPLNDSDQAERLRLRKKYGLDQ
tara:strand:+ start:4931 stop:6799 length:1869 start_codon:yes stop_codon:yes gene_type:complete